MTAPRTYVDRIGRVVAEAAARNLDAVVISPSPDLVYLTGYSPMPLERPTLLVLRQGRDPALLVPDLEAPLAATCPAAEVLELVAWKDGDDPYELAAQLLPVSGHAAACDRLWAVHLMRLQAVVRDLDFRSAGELMGELRCVKDAEELDALRRAAVAADRCFEQILDVGFADRRETDVAADLARLLVDNGHSRADFTIVASGPNSASPHHEPENRVISRGDVVVLDFGGELDGYYSDTSRTVVVGEPPEGLPAVFDLVQQAQSAAVATVRPGVLAQDVDRAARDVITTGGLGDRFIHRTGHGIGLEVHERPYMVEGDLTRLKPGMTFSVEPGVYLEGRFGVRIEDIVHVTEAGVERLNRSTRNLRSVN